MLPIVLTHHQCVTIYYKIQNFYQNLISSLIDRTILLLTSYACIHLPFEKLGSGKVRARLVKQRASSAGKLMRAIENYNAENPATAISKDRTSNGIWPWQSNGKKINPAD